MAEQSLLRRDMSAYSTEVDSTSEQVVDKIGEVSRLRKTRLVIWQYGASNGVLGDVGKPFYQGLDRGYACQALKIGLSSGRREFKSN